MINSILYDLYNLYNNEINIILLIIYCIIRVMYRTFGRLVYAIYKTYFNVICYPFDRLIKSN